MQASFGNILRLVDKNTGSIYSLVYTRNDDTTSYVRFNSGDKENLITIVMYNSEIRKGRWFDVTLDFMPGRDSLNLSIDECCCGIGKLKLSAVLQPDIYFGKHDYSIDVLSMAVRDLNVSGVGENHHFPLNESYGEKVHNEQGKCVGEVKNPNWLINDSYFWKKRFSYHSLSAMGVTFDESGQRLLFFNRDSLITYDVNTDQVTASVYRNKLPLPMVLGMSFYDLQRKLLYVYEVNGMAAKDPKVVSLDIDKGEWKVESSEGLPSQRHHHSSYYNWDKRQQLIFGGFGDRKYFNEFAAYDVNTEKWNVLKFSGDKIFPRMFSGMGMNGEGELYILGGNGNEQGEQSIGKVHYVDLYKVDLKNRQIRKLWDLGENTKLLVPARQLMFTPDTGVVYALCYPPHLPHTFLQLYKFSLEDGTSEILADSIPMLSEAIRTNANLWFNAATKEIYCCTLEFNDLNEQVEVSFYSLQYPAGVPVFPAEGTSAPRTGRAIAWATIGGVLLLLSVTGIWLWARWRRKSESGEAGCEDEQEPADEARSAIITGCEIKKNALYLFGELTMFDKEGRDITYLLSTKLRQLFCFVLLNSDVQKTGVTSEEIYAAIWPDKPVHNAKNLKGVTIANLRKILDELEGIDLVFEKGKFRIKPDERFYCDYFDFIALLEQATVQQGTGDINETLIARLIRVLSAGKFLKTMNDECFDLLKQNYEEQVIGLLYWKAGKDFARQDFNKVIQVCRLFFYIDPLNEVALWYELQALLKLHQTNAAKKRFRIFVSDYQKIMDEEYSCSFEHVVRNRMPEGGM